MLQNGKLRAAALEERFTRIKHDASLPVNAFKFCLADSGLTITDIDCIAYYEQPSDKLARQLWAGFPDIDYLSPDVLSRLDPHRPEEDIRYRLGYDGPIEFFEHHMSHAASSFYYSGFSSSSILIIDGVGEWATTSYGTGVGETITLTDSIDYPHSLGLLFSTLTSYLGFDVNDGEFKVMGLAPYGSTYYADKIRRLFQSSENGQFKLDLNFFDFTPGTPMFTEELVKLLGRLPRDAEETVKQYHQDIAASLQLVLEETLLDQVNYLYNQSGMENLCMAGGVALNCVANARIRRDGPFKRLFIPPGAGDEGGAIGAATLAHKKIMKSTGFHTTQLSPMNHAYLGPSYTNDHIHDLLDTLKIPYQLYSSNAELNETLSASLVEGKIIGWFQGRMEFGARALGARSILADPRQEDMRDRVNVVVKKRETFRPFSPVILAEKAQDHFKISHSNPFMVETCLVDSPLNLPAITHIDGSARVQTITEDVNPKLVNLLKSFERQTGCPMLLNTSFNIRGEPIVCTPTDALACFVRSNLDILVLEDILIFRDNLEDDYIEGVNEFYQLVDLARITNVSHDAYTLI